jgi:hypothetical protein
LLEQSAAQHAFRRQSAPADALFEIERTINGESAERRRAVRHNQRSIGDPKASSIGSSSGTVRSERWP